MTRHLEIPTYHRTVAYLRWLRMNTHWWRYFNASSGNWLKYERMRKILLSDSRWYRTLPANFHYDVSLDEFYKFLEQVLREFQIPLAALTDFKVFASEHHDSHLRQRLKQRKSFSKPHTRSALILRI